MFYPGSDNEHPPDHARDPRSGPAHRGGTRAELARRLSAEVGAPDEGLLFDLRLEADSREAALQRVVDVLAEMGVDQHFTFPSTSGTHYHPPGQRGVPADERPSEDEPPHLQMGSPHENEPSPYDPPPKDIP